MSRAVQERTRKLFDVDYICRNWSWLLNPARSEVPPSVPRSTVSAGEDAVVDPPVEEEAKIPSEDESSRLEPRPWRPNREGRLKRRGASKSPQVLACEQVSNDCDFVFLSFIKC